MSAYRSLLRVDAPVGERFELALERLRAGHAFFFRGLAISLASDALLADVVSAFTSSNVTERSALEDLRRAEANIRALRDASIKFAELTSRKDVRLTLVDDYGNGTIALCELVEGNLVWQSGFPDAAG